MHTDSAGTTDSAPTNRRSRLSPEREAELYVATLDLLRATGYAALTMEAIAARAKASKATLYRQWQSKPRLVAAALRHNKGMSLFGLNTGSLHGDLHETARRMAYGAAPNTALLASVAHAILGDPELGLAVRETIVEPESAMLDQVITRAVARGEVAPDNPAVGLVAHLLIGAVTGRPLVEGCVADEEYLHRYIDAVVLPALRRP
ncbi:TetR/AcrR family transcriptional regulator [Embleya scabrispora]|uniref:TetR/AcrR family transcriptional regulator n=1 Tax=Embleya scabrispora TaxID=159449 RepID=UPI000381FA6A|nr:TetR/AcrR family transcriptional regulator [Embleya scabrispora]MYS85466.1 TetR family transcriptional regulator [Streptomyces sp. SID5474]